LDVGPDYTQGQEALIVALARTGDREAFAELVRRRQSWLRLLMRRCCGDPTLADDLAQQAFLQAWRKLRQLRQPERFGPWLKRLAITGWLARLRSKDALKDDARQQHTDVDGLLGRTDVPAAQSAQQPLTRSDQAGLAIDLDAALSVLAPAQRLCVVLAYHEGLTHDEIAALTKLPIGTVKSHVRRGSERLRQLLAAYRENSVEDADER
jgi:RNA polymerase sigma factor (sigma-70 family)